MEQTPTKPTPAITPKPVRVVSSLFAVENNGPSQE